MANLIISLSWTRCIYAYGMCLDGQLNPEFTMYYMHIHVGMCSDGQLNSKSIMDYMHYMTVFNGSLNHMHIMTGIYSMHFMIRLLATCGCT